MTGKLVSVLVAAALLAGIFLLARDWTQSTGLRGQRTGGEGGGPQIVLRGVEMREARPDGRVYRLVSDDASYSILGAHVVASGVTLALANRGEQMVVTAPVASWNLNEGRIDLGKGAFAENGRGWTASAPRARIDLQSEEVTAEEADFAGPGMTVTGNNLRWHWDNGTVALDSPRSRVLPAVITGPGRRG